MTVKDMRKLVLICIICFAIGFGCLAWYYIDYQQKTELRHNSNVEDQILNNSSDEIQNIINNNGAHADGAVKGDTSYTNDQNDLEEYNKYVQEQLNQSTDASQEEQTSVYDKAIQKIRLKILSRDYDGAVADAYEITNNNVFHDANQFASLESIKRISGFDSLPGAEQVDTMFGITDPSIYVALFYNMKPEYQAFLLESDDFLYLGISAALQMDYGNTEEAGTYEGRVNEYYSDLASVKTYKVNVSVANIKYNIYVAHKEGYPMRITNITFEDKGVTAYSTYKDYFDMWGREEVDIYYD